MKAVVLAGGKGARLAPYTTILPKPLMPIGDMPILEVMLLQMKEAGIEQVILTVGHLSELLRAFFKDGSQFGIDISYSYEKCPCLLYTSPSPRDRTRSRMPSSA